MGTRRWIRSAAVAALAGVLAVMVFAVGTTSNAPAGNRNPAAVLVGLPGPSEVTYGQNVAYSATLKNTGKSNFTKLEFHNPVPTTSGGPAQLVYASCGNSPPLPAGATEFACDLGELSAGGTARVTIVWKTPLTGSSTTELAWTPWPDTCPASTPVCMTNSVFWIMKEGTGKPGSAGPDTFPAGPVVTSLLVVPDPVAAGGYALDVCTDPSTPTLTTNPSVGAGNDLTTSVCISGVPGLLFDPGLAIEIDEGIGPHNLGVTESSEICIPAPGDSCPETTPYQFSSPSTFTFVIDNTTLPKGEKIDTVFHNGDTVPFCADDPDADPCVVSITIDNSAKTTTVVVESSENGGWDFT